MTDQVTHIVANEGELRDVLGVCLRLKVSSELSAGQFCVSEATVPQFVGVPLHQHPDAEAFYVLEGEVHFVKMTGARREEIAAHPGDLVHVGQNAFHGFTNRSAQSARMLIIFPKGIESFFLEAGVPGYSTLPPDPAQIAYVLSIAEKHGQHFLPPQ